MSRKQGWLTTFTVSLLTCATMAHAQMIPEGLTVEQQKKVDQYIRDYIKVMRVKEPQPQPPAVAAFNKKYTEVCLKRAESEYKKHGRWFYCEDRREFGGGIRWDEVVTYRTYWQLYANYGALEKIPNYSKKNHEEAIKFWQSWQKKDGAFYNMFTGRGGSAKHSDQVQCNSKYIPPPNIMGMLGCKPFYKSGTYGAAKPDVAACLKQVAGGQMNAGTAIVAVMMKMIHAGETEYIPDVERAVELAVARISPRTGMFTGGGNWSGYGTTAETMKGLLRLIGYMGVENMPYRHVRADTIIANQTAMRKGAVSVKRNTAEMMVQCLLESPYRSDELLKALDGHSKAISAGGANSHMKGDYTAYVFVMFGPYLNWKGYDGMAPRTPFPTGVADDYRVEVGPFGRCANIIKKRPEELLWHKDFTYARYGLRARNTAHEKRKVIDVVPASSEGWAKSTDSKGRAVLTRTLKLEKAKLENPYLKIKWSGGDIEILLNGVLVKKKLAGLKDFGAVHIPDEARKTLKTGENALVVRSVGKAGALNASAGLIDWK